MAEAKKPRNFERAYSDVTGEVSISHNDDTVMEFLYAEVNGAEGITFPSTAASSGMRYVTDILVGVGNAALKADGGTIDKALAKMAETWESLKAGTFKFRSASGSASLSTEEEQEVIAETLVSMGKLPDVAAAMAKVLEVYGRTSKNAKGYTVRNDYRSMKNSPAIKAAIAKATGATTKGLDSILA